MIEKTSLSRRSRWVVGLFLILVVASVLGFLLDLFVMAAQPLDAVSGAIVVGLAKVVGVGVGFGPLAVAIAFCFWIHRANANLHAAALPHLEFTPGWAVGWFFVPCLSLWKPYEVMSEIWNGSAILSGRDTTRHPLVGWWWGLYLGQAIMGSVSRMMSSTLKLHADLMTRLMLEALSNGGRTAAAIMALLLVRRVTAMQLEGQPAAVAEVFD